MKEQTCKESQQRISSLERERWQHSAELSRQCMAAWSLSPELSVKTWRTKISDLTYLPANQLLSIVVLKAKHLSSEELF